PVTYVIYRYPRKFGVRSKSVGKPATRRRPQVEFQRRPGAPLGRLRDSDAFHGASPFRSASLLLDVRVPRRKRRDDGPLPAATRANLTVAACPLNVFLRERQECLLPGESARRVLIRLRTGTGVSRASPLPHPTPDSPRHHPWSSA